MAKYGRILLTRNITLRIATFLLVLLLEHPLSRKGCSRQHKLPELASLGKLAMARGLDSGRTIGLAILLWLPSIGSIMAPLIKSGMAIPLSLLLGDVSTRNRWLFGLNL